MGYTPGVAEKRKYKRYAKRLTARFGEKEPTHTAFVVDISAGGLFLASSYLPPLHTRIHIQVVLEGGKFVYFEGAVQRQKQVPPELRSVTRGGFGVKFLRPEELLAEIVPRSLVSTDRLVAAFASTADLKVAYEKEIRFGGLFVQTERKFERDAVVTISLKMSWLDRELELETKVVHISTEGFRGVALGFTEPKKAQEAISAFL